jgi:hypothetical protein
MAKKKKLADTPSSDLPSIISDEYVDSKKEVISFHRIDDIIVVKVGDKKFPHWQAIDVWKINSYSKD